MVVEAASVSAMINTISKDKEGKAAGEGDEGQEEAAREEKKDNVRPPARGRRGPEAGP